MRRSLFSPRVKPSHSNKLLLPIKRQACAKKEEANRAIENVSGEYLTALYNLNSQSAGESNVSGQFSGGCGVT